jgi:hypothetical protein
MQQRRHQPQRPTPPQHELHTSKLRFKIHETDKKILQITTEKDTEPPAIITRAKAKAQREYEETAQRMRKETK